MSLWTLLTINQISLFSMFLGRLQTITNCSIFYICFIDICNFCKWRSIFWSWYIPPGVGIPTRSACLEEYEKKKSSTRHSFIQSHVKVNINIKPVCFQFPWENLNKIRVTIQLKSAINDSRNPFLKNERANEVLYILKKN